MRALRARLAGPLLQPASPAPLPRTIMDEAASLLDAGMGARAVAEQLDIPLNQLSEFAAKRREERSQGKRSA